LVPDRIRDAPTIAPLELKRIRDAQPPRNEAVSELET
jgi:hypothetical protein